MLKLNERQPKNSSPKLAAKCDQRWKTTVDKTRFMDELCEGKLERKPSNFSTKTGALSFP